MRQFDIQNVDRRTMLKSIGSSTLGIAGFSGTSSATGQQLQGISYDTLTEKVGGPIAGRVEKQDGTLTGQIDIAGFSIPLEALRRAGGSVNPSYMGLLTGSRFTNGDQPLKIQLEEHTGPSPHFSGTITRPSGRFGRLGFYLTPDPNYDPVDAAEANSPDSRWVDSNYSFTVPNTGIPTDSGAERLANILPSPTTAERGGDQ